jgi:hypothetical protein
VDRKISYDLRQLAYDPDGDQLTFSLPTPSDEAKLLFYGLYF